MLLKRCCMSSKNFSVVLSPYQLPLTLMQWWRHAISLTPDVGLHPSSLYWSVRKPVDNKIHFIIIDDIVRRRPAFCVYGPLDISHHIRLFLSTRAVFFSFAVSFYCEQIQLALANLVGYFLLAFYAYASGQARSCIPVQLAVWYSRAVILFVIIFKWIHLSKHVVRRKLLEHATDGHSTFWSGLCDDEA